VADTPACPRAADGKDGVTRRAPASGQDRSRERRRRTRWRRTARTASRGRRQRVGKAAGTKDGGELGVALRGAEASACGFRVGRRALSLGLGGAVCAPAVPQGSMERSPQVCRDLLNRRAEPTWVTSTAFEAILRA
jgi:hypothetical protein